MATFEQIGLVLQIVGNIYGLVGDMRNNANGYKAQVAGGGNVSNIAGIMVEDAQQYLRRVQWISDLAARNLTLLTSCLSTLGLTIADANALKIQLNGVANHAVGAALGTGPAINTEADYILANTPVYERLW